MSVTLTQPAEGKQAGDTYTGPLEDWFVAQGYAYIESDEDNHLNTDVDASSDPTLAANREGADDDRVSYGDNKVRRSKAKNAPEVGAGEPRMIDGDEPDGPVVQTARPEGLEDGQLRAAAHVKGVSVDEVSIDNDPEAARAEAAERDEEKALANAPELTSTPEPEPTTAENVEGAAGDGQEVSDEEESRQDGDSAGA